MLCMSTEMFRLGRGWGILGRVCGTAVWYETEAGAKLLKQWSGRRGSNPRPTAWEAVTLPLSYSRSPVALTPILALANFCRAGLLPDN